jgi:SAM-dependent MidA family methyltransferase
MYDDFYTDAQYGPEFGYYSTGRVLLGSKAGKSTEEFSQFTTFPMAMAPHFGRIFCRTILRMWLAMDRPAEFTVLEFGAGSGQLASDVKKCVASNVLRLTPQLAGEFRAALTYSIVERSPALATRQRHRGLDVVEADAQDPAACERIRAAKGYPAIGAIVSNELLDAFAPVKLRYSVYENDTSACSSWQEVRLVHIAKGADLEELLVASQFADEARARVAVAQLAEQTRALACEAVGSSVGKLAMEIVMETLTYIVEESDVCAITLIVINVLMAHTDLQIPLAAHNLRWRLRHDQELRGRVADIVKAEIWLLGQPEDLLLIRREEYKYLRRSIAQGSGDIREAIAAELPFIRIFEARKIGTPLQSERCEKVRPWILRHQARVDRVIDLYGGLGYASVEFVLRPGEETFLSLADCIMPRGYIMSIDYGATFDALAHTTAGMGSDGVVSSVMPVPPGFPDCHTDWMKCPGLVDWTSFVDFTNMRDAGLDLGWEEDFYGPQNALEEIRNATIVSKGEEVVVPGYFVLDYDRSFKSHNIGHWYGIEFDEHQRYSNFKVLIQRKGAPPGLAVDAPSWHLDVTEMPRCFSFDYTDLPISDFLWRKLQDGLPLRPALTSLDDDATEAMNTRSKVAYDKAQIAVRLLDWLISRRGCSTAPVSNWDVWTQMWQSLAEEVGNAVLAIARKERTPIEPFECLALEAWERWCGA